MATTFVLAVACFGGSFAGTVTASRTTHTTPGAGVTGAEVTAVRTENVGAQLLDWEQRYENGHPYVYGGTGPYGYDCSGAVYAAALRVLPADGIRISWPRDTYDLESAVYSGRLRAEIIPVSRAERGDLLIWPGWSHVEIKTIWHNGSYGAQNTGTFVTWHTYNGYWEPMLAVRILL